MKKVFAAKQSTTGLISIGLVDATGAAISAANVSAATLTYWNAEQSTSDYINARNAQNVKGANNGAVTDGNFTWALQPADTVIVDQARAIGDTELHMFRLDVAHSQSGSPFSEVYGVRVECQRLGANPTPTLLRSSPSIALATVDDILTSEAFAADPTPTTDHREAFAQAILAFSEQVERETSRWLWRSRTAIPWVEVLDLEYGQQLLQLRGYPLASVASIKIDWQGDFANPETVLDPTDFTLFQGGRTGQVKLRSWAPTVEGPGVCQVTYVGGLAADVHGIPADLRAACVEQVALMVKRAPNVAISGQAQSGGSVTYFRSAALCTNALDAINRYRTQS